MCPGMKNANVSLWGARMPSIVIYGSQYGTAKQYAEELVRRTGIELCPYDEVGDINSYGFIAYIGALYAGGVKGMKKTFGQLASCTGKTILISTVGLADPTDAENVETIERGMRRQLSAEVFEAAHIFHLRSGIDYSKLGFRHQTMMRLLCNKAKYLLPKAKQRRSGDAHRTAARRRACTGKRRRRERARAGTRRHDFQGGVPGLHCLRGFQIKNNRHRLHRGGSDSCGLLAWIHPQAIAQAHCATGVSRGRERRYKP